MIGLGAVRIVVPGNFAQGCFPSTLTNLPNDDPNAYDEFGCLIYVNDLIQLLNNNIQQALDMLRKEYPDVVIIYADYYSAFRSVLNRAPFLGQFLQIKQSSNHLIYMYIYVCVLIVTFVKLLEIYTNYFFSTKIIVFLNNY